MAVRIAKEYKYAKEKNTASIWKVDISRVKHRLKTIVFYIIMSSKTRLYKSAKLFLTPHLLINNYVINIVAGE